MFVGQSPAPSARPQSPGVALKKGAAAKKSRGPSVDPAPRASRHHSVTERIHVDLEDAAADTFSVPPAADTNVLEDHTNLPMQEAKTKSEKKKKEQKIDYFDEFGAQLPGEGHEWRKLVAESWMKVPKKTDNKHTQSLQQAEKEEGEDVGTDKMQVETAKKVSEADQKGKKEGFLSNVFGTKQSLGYNKLANAVTGKAKEGEDRRAEDGSDTTSGMDNLVPKTFEDMGLFNAKMMGANITWVDMMFKRFGSIVRCTVNNDVARLDQETSILALRMNKDTTGSIDLKEFGVCMGSSMQSLRGKAWNNQYSKAWSHLWKIVSDRLQSKLALPHKYEKAVQDFVMRLDQAEKNSFGLAVFKRLFDAAPRSESYFKQSNTRLCFIVSRALEMSMEIYQEPTRLANDVMSLGIRHIMWNIPTTFFEPFLQAMLDECLFRYSTHPLGVEGLEWALRIIAGIMVQTIDEGSSPLIEAVVRNRPKAVKKALADYPRRDRAIACL